MTAFRAVLGIAFAVLLTFALHYVSPYWSAEIADRDLLAAVPEAFRPAGDDAPPISVAAALEGVGLSERGNWVERWLRMAPRTPVNWGDYAIVLWGVGAFPLLSAVQWLWSKVFR